MAWELSQDERQQVIQRLAQNISDISFFQYGKNLSEAGEVGVLNLAEAREVAVAVERKAYTAARVASSTTTGARPKEETVQAYTRKLAELALEAVKSKSYLKQRTTNEAASKSTELDLTGGREFITVENLEDYLQPLLAHGSKLTKVKFSTKSFDKESAAVVAEALEGIQDTLVDADLSDVIAGRPEDVALEVLSILTKALAGAKLKHLNLSDNALGEKGLRACATALTSQTGLQSLSLQNIGCSVHACRAVEELFTASGELRQLHLFNNMSDDAGAGFIAKLLARSPKMEDFKMASSRVKAEGGVALAKGLMAGTSLVKLELSDNPLTEEAADALAELVQAQPNLLALNLNDTCLAPTGVNVVCKALQDSAPQLQELELALNEINPASCVFVSLAISNKQQLRKLVLRENEMKDAGVLKLSQLLLGSCPNLEVLDLVQNQITRVGAVAAAKAAVTKPNLQLLALDDNMISDEGVEEVEALLRAAGKQDALGPLDENDPEGEPDDEEDEEEEEEGEGAQAAKELEALFAKLSS